VLLRVGGLSVITDPHFSERASPVQFAGPRRVVPPVPALRDLPHIDAVLVSHCHYDHAMDAGVVAIMTGAVLIGSESTANIGRGAGVPNDQIATVRPGNVAQIGSFQVTFIESQQAGASGGRPTGNITAPLLPPFHYMDYKQGGTYSILIEHPLGTVLHHGSAGFVPGALKSRRADVVFLGIALLPDLKTYLAETVDAVGAKHVIPVHWDDFTRGLDEPLMPFPMVVRLDRFFDDMARLWPSVEVQTLEMGRRYPIFPSSPDAPTQ